MVKDYTDSERGNPLPPHGLLLPISSKDSLYVSSHRQDNTYHGLFHTSWGNIYTMAKLNFISYKISCHFV